MITKKGIGFSFEWIISLRAVILDFSDLSDKIPLILSWNVVGIEVNDVLRSGIEVERAPSR